MLFPYEVLSALASQLRAAAEAESHELCRAALHHAACLVGAQATMARSESTLGPAQQSVVTHLDYALESVRAERRLAVAPERIHGLNVAETEINAVAGGGDFRVELITHWGDRRVVIVRADGADQAANRAVDRDGQHIVGPALLLDPRATVVSVVSC